MSTSSERPELRRIALTRLLPHPANANVMGPEGREQLRRHILRNGRCPPLVVRPLGDDFQLLDGHQRCEVLRELGHESAECYVWPCDDETALLLLATLNRLHGEDVPVKRGLLLDELLESFDRDALLELIPDQSGELDELLALARGDADPFAELEAEAARVAVDLPTTITFVVTPDQEQEILAVIDRRVEGRRGPRSRGEALHRFVTDHQRCEVRDA